MASTQLPLPVNTGGYVPPKKPKKTPGNPYAPPVRPPVAPPVDPYAPWTQDQIDKRATDIANSQLTPQQEEIRRQQKLAHEQALAQAEKISGLSQATAEMMKGLGPEAQAAYTRAADTEGRLGQGLATGAANDVAASVSADKAFMESQGQQGGPGPDTAALHDVTYGLNGMIPGDTFAEQGAAAAAWGLAQPPIALNAGREELAARMSQAQTENDQYAQQLIQLAAQFPALKAQALDQLNRYELDKANYRLNRQQENANEAHQRRADALAARSERAQERAAGLTAGLRGEEMKYRWASLAFQNKKAMLAAQAAAAKGKTIDVQASKLLGHIVYKDGSEDPSIKVKQGGTITAQQKAKAISTARRTAYDYSVNLLGVPVKAAKGSKGAYVAAPDARPGTTFPPAYPGGPRTTNNPKSAARQGGAASYNAAQQKVWAEIDGDGLIQNYGYSKAQVLTIINTALARAGWKRKK